MRLHQITELNIKHLPNTKKARLPIGYKRGPPATIQHLTIVLAGMLNGEISLADEMKGRLDAHHPYRACILDI
jgi:hypothetical protein